VIILLGYISGKEIVMIKVQSMYIYVVLRLVFRTQILNVEVLALALVEVLRFVEG
jgi:hypothetical protein